MSLLRSGAYTLVASLVQIVLGFAGVTIVARALGPDGKGIYDLYLTAANLAALALSLALPAGVTYVIAQGQVRLRAVAAQLLLITAVVAALTTAASIAASHLPGASRFLPSDLRLLVAVGMTAGATAGYGLFRSVLVGQRAFGAASAADIARAAAVLLGLIIAVLISFRYTQLGATVVAWGYTTATVVAVAIYMAVSKVRPAWRGIGHTPELRRAINYSLPSYAGNLLQFLNYRIDVFLVGGLLGVAAVGRYQLAVMLAELLRVLPAAAQAVIWPTVASDQQAGQRNAALTARISRAVFSATIVGSLCLAGIAGPSIPFVFGERFWPSVPALIVLLPGLAFFAVTTVLAGYIAGIGRPGLNLRASAIGFGVTIVLDLVLIPRWGILGAATASTLSYSVSTLYTIFLFVQLTDCSIRDVLMPRLADLMVVKDSLRKALSSSLGNWKLQRS